MARRIDLTPMPPFDAHGSPSSLGQHWKQWLTRFQTYVTASGITDDTQKRAMLLYLAGPAVQDMFDTLSETGEAKDFKIAHKKLIEYFAPKKNATYEVYVFRKARQHEKETLAQFETRLRKLAATCEFTDTEGEIKNQIIQQCTNSRIRRRALREPTWKLADILDFCRSFETGNAQATEIEMSLNSMSLQDSHKATVNKVQIKKKKWPKRELQSNRQLKQTTQSPCNNCGLPHHKNGTCPARGQTCKACNKKNQYARCCRSIKTQTKQTAQPGRINQVQTVPDLVDSSQEDSSSDELSDECLHS